MTEQIGYSEEEVGQALRRIMDATCPRGDEAEKHPEAYASTVICQHIAMLEFRVQKIEEHQKDLAFLIRQGLLQIVRTIEKRYGL